jgi:hypothetical protein
MSRKSILKICSAVALTGGALSLLALRGDCSGGECGSLHGESVVAATEPTVGPNTPAACDQGGCAAGSETELAARR